MLHQFKELTKNFEFFFVLFFAWSYIIETLEFTRHFIKVGIIDTVLFYSFLLWVFLNVLPTIRKRIKPWPFLVSCLIIIILLFSCLFSSDVETNYSVISDVLLYCIPLLILGSCIYDFDRVYKYLLIVLCIYLIISVISFLLFGLSLPEDETYSQDKSYKFLLPAIVLLYATFERFSFTYLVLFIGSVLFILAYGARGPIVAIGVFVVIYLLLLANNRWTKKTILILSSVAILIVFGIVYFESYIYVLLQLLGDVDMSTRSVAMIMNGTIMESEERTEIIDICVNGILHHPILGVGPGNDRNFIYSFFHSENPAPGYYPHNFFLEVPLQFGIIWGGLLILAFFILLYRAYGISKIRKLLIIVFSVYFVPLIYTGSYLITGGFYLLISICVANIPHKRKKTLLENKNEVMRQHTPVNQ